MSYNKNKPIITQKDNEDLALSHKSFKIRRAFLKQNCELSTATLNFLANPTKMKYPLSSVESIYKNKTTRIDKLDFSILVSKFSNQCFDKNSSNIIAEKIIENYSAKLRSLDPRDYDISEDLIPSLHSREDRLALIKLEKQQINNPTL